VRELLDGGRDFLHGAQGGNAAKENVTLLGHCAEDATECHRFELQKLIARETGVKAWATRL
jgi:hypothetical protein